MSNAVSPFNLLTGSGVPVIETGTERAASPGTVAAASLIQDPRARMRYYSQQMGIPLDRFGIQQGQIAYSRPGTGLPPQAVSPGPLRGFLKGLGPSFPAVGGTVGGIASIPFGPAGMAVGGTAGAMTGQAAREYIAKGLAGQEVSAGRIAFEGGVDLAASLAGMLIGKGLTRAAVTAAAKQFKTAMDQGRQSASQALQGTLDAVNKTYGTNIKISAAELTNNADMIAVQKTLAGDPRTGETMSRFAAERGAEVGRALSQGLEDIGPTFTSREAAGAEMSGAAEQSMVDLAMARARAGKPAYDDAFEAGASIDVSGTIKSLEQAINKNPRLAGKFRQALKYIADPVTNKEGKVIGYKSKEGVSLEYVQDNVKELLDDFIGAASRAGRNKEAMRLKEVQGNLLKEMDGQVPEYAAARKIWGDLSRPIDDVEGGLLPTLAKATNKDFEFMGARFLTNSSPSAIKAARDNILKVDGGQDIWNNFVRGALEQSWEKASKPRIGELGRPDLRGAMPQARFWSQFGAGDGYERLQAALSPDQMKAMENLLTVMEGASRAIYTGSDTAAKESAKELVGSLGAPGLLQFAAAPWRVLGALSDATSRQLSNANVRKLADVMTNEGSVDMLLGIAVGKGQGAFNERNLILVANALNNASGVGMSMARDSMSGPGIPSEPSPDAPSAPSAPQGVTNPFDM